MAVPDKNLVCICNKQIRLPSLQTIAENAVAAAIVYAIKPFRPIGPHWAIEDLRGIRPGETRSVEELKKDKGIGNTTAVRLPEVWKHENDVWKYERWIEVKAYLNQLPKFLLENLYSYLYPLSWCDDCPNCQEQERALNTDWREVARTLCGSKNVNFLLWWLFFNEKSDSHVECTKKIVDYLSQFKTQVTSLEIKNKLDDEKMPALCHKNPFIRNLTFTFDSHSEEIKSSTLEAMKIWKLQRLKTDGAYTDKKENQLFELISVNSDTLLELEFKDWLESNCCSEMFANSFSPVLCQLNHLTSLHICEAMFINPMSKLDLKTTRLPSIKALHISQMEFNDPNDVMMQVGHIFPNLSIFEVKTVNIILENYLKYPKDWMSSVTHFSFKHNELDICLDPWEFLIRCSSARSIKITMLSSGTIPIEIPENFQHHFLTDLRFCPECITMDKFLAIFPSCPKLTSFFCKIGDLEDFDEIKFRRFVLKNKACFTSIDRFEAVIGDCTPEAVNTLLENTKFDKFTFAFSKHGLSQEHFQYIARQPNLQVMPVFIIEECDERYLCLDDDHIDVASYVD